MNESKHKCIASKAIVLGCFLIAIGLTGCPDGSSEKAGQRMNHPDSIAKKTIESSSKSSGKPPETINNPADPAADQSKHPMDHSIQPAKEVLEKPDINVEQNAESDKK